MASAHLDGSDHEDDAAIEEAVSKDAFGLSSFSNSNQVSTKGNSKTSAKASSSRQGPVASVKKSLVTNPDVLTEDLSRPSTSLITRPTDTIMNINLSYEDMTRPIEGPENVLGQLRGSSGGAGLGRSYNTVTGHVEQQAMSDVDFKNQQMTYNVLNYARNPSIMAGTGNGSDYVGDAGAAAALNGQSLHEYRPPKAEVKSTKRKRKGKGKLGVFDDNEDEKGEGQSSEEESGREKAYMGPWAGWKDEATRTLVPAEEEYEIIERRRGAAPVDKSKKEVGFGEEKSIFHGKSMHDYQGRTYMHVPRDVDTNLTSEPGTQDCFIPKACVHTWTGHTKGVTAIRLFPQSGHLMLSSSMDTRVKLWDVYHDGKCLRTFMGHGQAVRDITFNNDGSRFLSAGYDRYMKLWDTETGQCIQAFTNGKIPYCIKFNPDPEKQDIFLAGMSDKKIVQYDIRSGDIAQEYDQHLGPVNTITFMDDSRRFVTTSDDKSIRAWDYDIPVVVKYIAEPYMHSLPAVTMHPNKKWLGMQSLDNQILLFSAPELKQNRKKRFAGHNIAGYACEVGFSPDGKFVSSGDGQGDLVFWDFKTCRLVKRLKAHSKAVISHAWLPHESSKIITGSWDGTCKLWD